MNTIPLIRRNGRTLIKCDCGALAEVHRDAQHPGYWLATGPDDQRHDRRFREALDRRHRRALERIA